MVHHLTLAQARRLAVRAQRLDADRPGDIVETLDALRVLNIDPTSAVAPSADHILWSRIGWPYQPADLARAVEVDRTVFEWGGFYRPMEDLPLYRPRMRAWPPHRRQRDWLDANDAFRRDVLDRLRDAGPLRTGEIPDTSVVPWTSSGWTNSRNVTQMLEFLTLRGEVAISGRDGRERVWDLSERVYPDLPDVDEALAARRLAENRLRSLGIARARSVQQPGEPIDVGEVGDEAEVDGVPGRWRVDAAALDALDAAEARAALLSPFDRLVFDRARTQELFGFDYVLEMYKPAHRRRWGYFALPVLVGDELIGKLDAKAEPRAGVLRIARLHEDRPFTQDERGAVGEEINDLARWLGLETAGWERA